MTDQGGKILFWMLADKCEGVAARTAALALFDSKLAPLGDRDVGWLEMIRVG